MSYLRSSLIRKYETSKDRKAFFYSLGINEKVIVLEGISEKSRKELLDFIKEDELLLLFSHLDPDEITDILYYFDDKKQDKLKEKLNKRLQEKVDFLLKFAPDSAAGIMSLNFIIVNENYSKKQILDKVEKHVSYSKKEPTILVENSTGGFMGELLVSELFFGKKKECLKHLKKIPIITYNEDTEEIIRVFSTNKNEKIVVLDLNGEILGIIHAKDVFKVAQKTYTEDFYSVAGLDKEEDIADTVFEKIKFRLGWLFLNFFSLLVVAFVVSLFEGTISKLVMLASFMPVVAGMGGNAATQTNVIVIRALSLGKLHSDLYKKVLIKEFLASLVNGLIVAFMVFPLAYFFDLSLMFGFVAAMAVIINFMVAAIFGTLIPLILKMFGFDPAVASSVFITTFTDVIGFFSLLGLATLLLI